MMTAIPRISGPTSSRTPPYTTRQMKISVPMNLAADVGFLSPGTKVYVPALERYYVMEDTCRECSEDWLQNKRTSISMFLALGRSSWLARNGSPWKAPEFTSIPRQVFP